MKQTINSEARIKRLEYWNMLLLGMVLVLFVIVLLNIYMPRDLVVNKLRLLDDAGIERANLSISGLVVRFLLKDEAGNERLALEYQPEGTGLYIYDDVGTTRIGVAQFSHGGGGVALHGAESKGAAVLYLKETGRLSFYDNNGLLYHPAN